MTGIGPSGVPPVHRTALPAHLRDAGPERRREYAAALGFERQLVEQLAGRLAEGAGSAKPASAATAAYRDLLPGALADALTAAGGLGLAADLDRALHGPAAPAAGDAATGGSTA